MEVKCPGCGQPSQYSEKNPFRPFCSERCKLIDLGAWAEGKYAIPAKENTADEFAESVENQSEDSDSEENPPEDRRH
ncbi:MAG TPA: DNA gyrase inhibitor YacG [Bdellovibrionales bacterium]|nr:DNA gyrase inhibitor YacG [Bdellovibrionales bacterium]